MIAQRNKDKENSGKGDNCKSGNMLHKAIELLKQDKDNLVRENQQRQKYHQEQKKKLRQEIDGYKRKIAELTQANVINNLVKKEPSNSKHDSESVSKIKRLQLEVEHFKKIITDRQKSIDSQKAQIKQLEKKLKLMGQQKQKHLEVSLTQKIVLEQRIQLLQKEAQSKKKIIEGLKKEIQKASKLEFQVTRKQREIIKRGRDMNKYEEEFQSYYSDNQKKNQRKIQAMEAENKFLRKEVKKIAKKIKSTCQCQGEAEEWKQKLYEVGRQLARARVELSRTEATREGNGGQAKKKVKQIRHNFQSDDNSESIGSLTLSQQSEEELSNRPTEKKR